MSSTPSSPPSLGTGRGSPTSGCFILITIIVVFGGLIVWFAIAGSKQYSEMGKFTSSEALEIKPLIVDAEAQAEVDQKLGRLRDAMMSGEAVRVGFNATEVNALMAGSEGAEQFRGTAYVKKITDAGMLVTMTQQLRRMPFSQNERFLNGDFLFRPELRARTIAFVLQDLKTEVGTPPDMFVKNYATLDFFKIDPDSEEMLAYAAKLDAIYTEGDEVIVETKEAEAPTE